MAQIDDSVLEDMKTLLTDCARQFRKQEEAERASLEGTASLVEIETATAAATRFGTLAAACEMYADLASPLQTA